MAPADWSHARLRDLVDDRGITYGVVQPGQPVADGVPILRVNNFGRSRLHLNRTLRIDPDIAGKYARSRLQGGEVLVTLVGTVGLTAVAPPEVAGWNVARAVGVVPVKDPRLSRWVRWCLEAPSSAGHFNAHVNTTVQTTLNLRDLGDLEIPLPSPDEQRRIAAVLGALDDKIDSNERLAEALAETATAVVRHATAGSAERAIYDVSTVTYGAPFSSKLFGDPGDGLPLIRIRDLKTQAPGVWTTEERAGARLIRPGDIVVGMDAEFRASLWAGEPAWLNQRVCAFDPVEGVSRAYLLEVIKKPLTFFEATKGGTTVIHLGKRDIDTFTVPRLTDDQMRDLVENVDPLVSKSVALRRECTTLRAIRDELLPKLVSGEIRVPPGGADDGGEELAA